MANEINAVAGQLWGVPVGQVYTAGPGIVIDNVHKTVRVDETVLWENSSGAISATLSESYTNFEKIKVIYRTNEGCDTEYMLYSSQTNDRFTLLGYAYNGTNLFLKSSRFLLSSTSITLDVAAQYQFQSSSGVSRVDTLNHLTLYKIVGVNRISS